MFTYWGVRPGAVTPFGAVNDTGGAVTEELDQSLIGDQLINCPTLVNDQTIGVSSDGLLASLKQTGHEPVITAIPERQVTPA